MFTTSYTPQRYPQAWPGSVHYDVNFPYSSCYSSSGVDDISGTGGYPWGPCTSAGPGSNMPPYTTAAYHDRFNSYYGNSSSSHYTTYASNSAAQLGRTATPAESSPPIDALRGGDFYSGESYNQPHSATGGWTCQDSTCCGGGGGNVLPSSAPSSLPLHLQLGSADSAPISSADGTAAPLVKRLSPSSNTSITSFYNCSAGSVGNSPSSDPLPHLPHNTSNIDITSSGDTFSPVDFGELRKFSSPGSKPVPLYGVSPSTAAPTMTPINTPLYCPGHRQDPNNKPPYSYITLIVSAMRSKSSKRITLNEIYAWIMANFAYYRKNVRRWQNSIRHALSFNDCFVKVARPPGEAGKGHYWTVHPDALDMFDNGSSMRRNRKFIDERKEAVRQRRRLETASTPTGRDPSESSNDSMGADKATEIKQEFSDSIAMTTITPESHKNFSRGSSPLIGCSPPSHHRSTSPLYNSAYPSEGQQIPTSSTSFFPASSFGMISTADTALDFTPESTYSANNYSNNNNNISSTASSLAALDTLRWYQNTLNSSQFSK